jgi:NAD(P)-dependent dehydrogenase (short-subunit alcohol dehydrogenase family)
VLPVQADIRRVAHEVRDRYDHVDILVNNAGAAFSRRYVPEGIAIGNYFH